MVFNPFTGKFDLTYEIPEKDSDPSSPVKGDSWVLRTGGSVVGTPIGLLLVLTYGAVLGGSYQFSYRTAGSTTVRTTLT